MFSFNLLRITGLERSDSRLSQHVWESLDGVVGFVGDSLPPSIVKYLTRAVRLT
jgi:hypothetical protein